VSADMSRGIEVRSAPAATRRVWVECCRRGSGGRTDCCVLLAMSSSPASPARRTRPSVMISVDPFSSLIVVPKSHLFRGLLLLILLVEPCRAWIKLTCRHHFVVTSVLPGLARSEQLAVGRDEDGGAVCVGELRRIGGEAKRTRPRGAEACEGAVGGETVHAKSSPRDGGRR